jgi:hypothetical protein
LNIHTSLEAAVATSGALYGSVSPSHHTVSPHYEYPVAHNGIPSPHVYRTHGYGHLVASPETTVRPRLKKRSARPENAWQARGRLRKMEKDVGIRSRNKSRDDRLGAHYENRDIVFLVDNQGSMSEFWEEARWIFETLLMISRNVDENGMDLSFSCSGFAKPHEKKVNALLSAFDNPEVAPKPGTATDIIRTLETVFNEYLARIDQERECLKSGRRNSTLPFWPKKTEKDAEVKNATLIILTDGVWPKCQKDDFVRIFRSFTEGMNHRGHVVNSEIRSYSVEFMRFGENPKAIDLLCFLDDELEPLIGW